MPKQGICPPERYQWKLEVHSAPWAAEPLHFDTTQGVGDQGFVTNEQGRYLLSGIGECVQALTKRDAELHDWTAAHVKHLHNLQEETKGAVEELNGQILTIHQQVAQSAISMVQMEGWSKRAGLGLDQLVSEVKQVQQTVQDLIKASGKGFQDLRSDVGAEFNRFLGEIVQPGIRELGSGLKEIQDRVDKVLVSPGGVRGEVTGEHRTRSEGVIPDLERKVREAVESALVEGVQPELAAITRDAGALTIRVAELERALQLVVESLEESREERTRMGVPRAQTDDTEV